MIISAKRHKILGIFPTEFARYKTNDKPMRPHPVYVNVYQDLKGHLNFRKNPTSGLYYFDGQFFYRNLPERVRTVQVGAI